MRKWLKSTETLLFSVRDKTAYITLNRPERRNALTMKTLQELHDALLEADDRMDVHSVVLAGAGLDFCAGWDLAGNDLNPVASATAADADEDTPVYRSASANIDDDSWQLERITELRMVAFDMHKPVICRLHGNCIANGSDIAFLCDLLIADENASIGYPPVRVQGSPASHMWLYHIGPQWAKRFLLTGDSISGRDAERLGLVLKAVPAAQLDEEIADLTRRFAAISPDLLACNKRIVNLGLELMGARTLQRLASETDARGHLSAGRMAFRRNCQELGVKEAVRQRDEPFGDGRIRLRD
ncbi:MULTISPECIES: crotonase/enoyl-CoA hydratase family protein [Burkholderia]|uniref:crotonase/enoyl-CoA hydratase family protein n=1 Tax=Burkholderia TaxID=32008 RepID=UPI00158CE57E|nr:crotonase/enoyl-CoA hydratase family protein [Burkholderia seminalis]